MQKTRLDQYLLQHNVCSSREKAKNMITAGSVTVNQQVIYKPSHAVKDDDEIEVIHNKNKYVSRGGEKLKKALDHFEIDVAEKVVLDLGSSTGGFVDCLLRSGAKKVYAVDVGYGQLDYSLRINPRVIVMERRNARSLTIDDFKDEIGIITADLSFISISKALRTVAAIFDYEIEAVLLIKPQFEAESHQHKKGVVKNKYHHKDILIKVIEALQSLDIKINGITYSPMKGPKGNIEFLLHCTLHCSVEKQTEHMISIVDVCVEEAHAML